MLVVVLLPFADLRPLLAIDTQRLARPQWDNPSQMLRSVNGSFVRRLGPVRKRRGHGDLSWENEGVYCDARRAVRFPEPLPSYPFGSTDQPIRGLKGSSSAGSRRYYSYGPVVRLEIGLSRIWGPHELSGRGLQSFLLSILRMPVQIGGEGAQVALHSSTERLIPLILRSTSRQSAPPPQLQWLRAGEIALFVEYHAGEMDPGPPAEPLIDPAFSLNLCHWDLELGGEVAQAWLLGRHKSSNVDAARKLRMHIVRLHSELTFARLLLDVLEEEPHAEELNMHRVEAFLERFLGLVNREDVYGHAQGPLLTQALASHQSEDPDDWGVTRQAAEQELDTLRSRITTVFPKLG